MPVSGARMLSPEQSAKYRARTRQKRCVVVCQPVTLFIAAPSVQRRPTGIRVYLDYTYPVTWDDLTREYIWYLGGLNYQVYINGEAAGEPIAVNHRWIDVALMESERKGIDSLVLRPVLHIVQTFQDPQGDDSSEQDILMPQFDIVIPLR